MASRLGSRNWRAGLAVAVVTALFAAGACGSEDPDPLPEPRTTVFGPGSDTVRISEAQHASLVAIGVAQEYGGSYGAGDHQRLMVGRYPGSARHGPLVAIQPNDSSHLVGRSRLAAGFVVARFINRESPSYPKLGILGSDTTYWFVDSLPRGTWRSRYVSSRFSGTIIEDTTLVIHPSDTTHARALARWVWLDSDEAGWVTCTSAGCCTSRNAVRALTEFEAL